MDIDIHTAQFDSLPPNDPANPLIYEGLNYTTFLVSSKGGNDVYHLAANNHLSADASANPKIITMIPPFLGFNLYSISLSCGETAMPNNCTVSMFGTGNTASGAESTITLPEGSMQSFGLGGQQWSSLTQIQFTSFSGGQPVELNIGSVQYALTKSC